MNRSHLGTDVLFDQDGDLMVSSTGDLMIATGSECLLQDIQDRLSTIPGDLFAHSGWGCGIGRLLGAMDRPLNRAIAIRYIRQSLEDDPRVQDNTISIKPLLFTSEVKQFEIQFTPIRTGRPELLVWGFGVNESGQII